MRSLVHNSSDAKSSLSRPYTPEKEVLTKKKVVECGGKKVVEWRERRQSLGWKNVSWQGDFKSDTCKKKWKTLLNKMWRQWRTPKWWGEMGSMQSQNPGVNTKSNPGQRKVKSITQVTQSLTWASPYSLENKSSPERDVERREIRVGGRREVGERERENAIR